MIQFGDDFILYDLTECSTMVGLPRYRLEELLRDGVLLAGVVHGGRWMVDSTEVERFTREYAPPARASRAGVTRRFRPPDLPADPST